MKTYKRLFLLFCCTVVLFSNLFMCYKTPVFAKPTLDEDGHLHVYNWDDIKDSAVDWVMYMASMAGAIFADHDFAKYVQSKEAWVNYWKEDNVVINEDGTSVTFSKELMAFIKQCIEEYAKTEQTKEENGGFLLLPTVKYDDVPASHFYNGTEYRTFRNIMLEKGVLVVGTRYRYRLRFCDPFSNPDHPILLVAEAKSLQNYLNNPELRLSFNFFCSYDWTIEKSKAMDFPSQSIEYSSISEAVHDINLNGGYITGGGLNVKEGDAGNFDIYSTTGERVRVFVSQYAAQNYSVGNRKIYFSENYYNYVPEDLTVSIDDLQKSVDDLQKIIDELLKQIGNDTSEKEIEELLRLILEELRKNPGTGSGEGSGGGNVTVDIDLSTTNNWLSKIYTRLGDILAKISESAGQSMNDVVEGIENLKKMLEKYLKTITSDLDDIKGQLEDMSEQEFNDKSDSFLDSATESFSEISEVAKTKFPLSIPNDLRNLLAVISPDPPEAGTAALLSVNSAGYDDTGPVSYDGMISVMDDSGGDAAHLSSSGAPVFHLPIVVESVGWDYAITVDLSGFQIVATLSRTFFTLIFIVGLIQLSIKVVGLWGDLVQ